MVMDLSPPPPRANSKNRRTLPPPPFEKFLLEMPLSHHQYFLQIMTGRIIDFVFKKNYINSNKSSKF